MYKVPRERTKERTRPFVNSVRFKPPLKTLFELRKCVFRERRIESREKLFVWLSKTNRKKRVFPQKQSKREEGVGCRSTFSSSRFEKSFYSSKLAEKEPKRELSTKKKELKKEDEKAQRQKASFFQANRGERKTTCILTKESVIKLVNSLKRALSKKKREVRERLLRSRKAE